MALKSIALDGFEPEIFNLFMRQTPLLMAGDEAKANMMVIGWGNLGTLWQLPVCTVYVRMSRYTLEFMDREDTFSVCVLGDGWKDAKRICGTQSGRDIDKVAQCGFDIAYGKGQTPYIAQSKTVIICKKLYWQDMDPDNFLDERVAKCYPDGDIHRTYVGEVLEILCDEEG